MREERLLDNAARAGQAIMDALRAALAGAQGVTEIRGMGMMIGVEFEEPCGELVKAGLEAGLVINVTADKVVRIMPPLVMSEAEGTEVVRRFTPLARAFLEKRAAA
jgi:acetylornithine/N-succinyldiaminopimelate aminotransferase